MATPAASLESHIQEEFLQCQICFDHFKQPKSLPCLHTFCRDCLHKYIGTQTSKGKFNCPMCRNTTDVPNGGVDMFKTNFIIQNLMAIVTKSDHAIKVKMCESCTEHPACVYCDDCEEALCEACKDAHKRVKVTRDHILKDLTTTGPQDCADSKALKDEKEEVDVADVATGNWLCKSHPKQSVTCFCMNCSIPLCALCIGKLLRMPTHPHTNHSITSVEFAKANFQKETDGKLDDLRSKMSDFEGSMASLEDQEGMLNESFKKVQSDINTQANHFRSLINDWAKKATKKAELEYKKQVDPLVTEKTKVSSAIKNLSECSKLAEDIISSHDMSCLLKMDEVRGGIASALLSVMNIGPLAIPKVVSLTLQEKNPLGLVDAGKQIMEALKSIEVQTAQEIVALKRHTSEESLVSEGADSELGNPEAPIGGKRKPKISFKMVGSFRILDAKIYGVCAGRGSDVFFVDGEHKEILHYVMEGNHRFKFAGKIGVKKSKGNAPNVTSAGAVSILKEPLDIDQLPDGRLVVTDGKEGHSVKVLNVQTGKQVANLAHGFLKKPTGVACTPDGRIVVSDVDVETIVCFSFSGEKTNVEFKIEKHNDRKQFDSPLFVACSQDGKIAVSDRTKSTVKVFASDGNFRYQYGRWGELPVQMKVPEGICFDPAGRLYIADVGNNRIHILSSFGKLLGHLHVARVCGKFMPKPSLLAMVDADHLLLANMDGFVKIVQVTHHL